jgi:F0F1-type ATP synthase membrane subunit b/b'
MADTNVQPFVNEIAAYEREFKKWEGRVDKLLKRYRDDRTAKGQTDSRFNILWSNVQTLVPATYSRIPQPDVSRRFKDNDPVGRIAALILERGLEFEIQHYPDYRETMKKCVYDRFLGGRGTLWARYEPHIRAKQTGEPTDGLEVSEDVDTPYEELDYECAPVDYVHWKDFGHTVARTWEEVPRVWRKVYMTREMCVERFGEAGKSIPLDTRPDDQKTKAETDQDTRALIYEIWDKDAKRAYWLSKSLGKMMDERADPLELEGFFPCPKPLFATLTNDSLVPIPDFTLYQDQARELDVISDRIDGLINALKVRGVYNAEFQELSRLFTEGENNSLIPVKNFMAFAEKQGLKGAIDLVDLTPIANALEQAYRAMEQVKQQVYDITGLADIVRGQSEASETATAQQIKGQYASMRLNSMKHAVAEFATETLRLKAQIMMGQFAPETLLQISGAEQFSEEDKARIPEAIALLKSENAKDFRIDIAADSLVQLDESQEKQDRMEMIQAVGVALQKAEPVIAAAPELAPMVLQLIKFGVSAFKIGKTVEGTIDEALDRLQESIKAKQGQPPPPNPEMLKIQAQQQAEQAKLAHEQQKAQAEAQLRTQEQQTQAAIEQHKNELEAQRESQKQAQEAQLEQMRLEFDRWKAQLDADTKILVAEISAKTAVKTAAMGANANADPNSETEISETGDVSPKQPLAELLVSVQENFEQLSLGFNELRQAHAEAQERQSQERQIVMPSGRKYIRRDNGTETQIIPVQ